MGEKHDDSVPLSTRLEAMGRSTKLVYNFFMKGGKEEWGHTSHACFFASEAALYVSQRKTSPRDRFTKTQVRTAAAMEEARTLLKTFSQQGGPSDSSLRCNGFDIWKCGQDLTPARIEKDREAFSNFEKCLVDQAPGLIQAAAGRMPLPGEFVDPMKYYLSGESIIPIEEARAASPTAQMAR